MHRQRYCRRLARNGKPGASLLTRSPSQLPRPARKSGVLDPSKAAAGERLTVCWREMDSNFRFRASSDYAGVGVLRSTWAVLTLRRRDPDWNATKRRRDSERRASTAAE